MILNQPTPKMKKYLPVLFLVISANVFAQSDTLDVNINLQVVQQALISSPNEIKVGIGQSLKSGQIIDLPYKNGEVKSFKLIEYDILPVALRKEIKTYYGNMVEDPTIGCRLTLANGEIRASLVGPNETIILEKNKSSVNENAYWVYEANQTLAECEVEELIQKQIDSPTSGNLTTFGSHGTQLRTYRLALIVTSSLYTAGGGTDATVNAYVASIVNNINGIFEKEIAVRFVLVSPNNPVSTNVFHNYGGGSTNLSAIRPEVLNRFGVANFDVGHCITSSGGGVANLGVVCNSSFKGGGLSGVSPTNILVFAHELGHQFNAGHTFNGNGSGNCGPGNRMNSHAYEPGSGNTIMSYANLCSPGSYNITGGKVPYFHTHNQTTMIAHITSRLAVCGVTTTTGNAAPVVTLNSSVTIPVNTPFKLSGTATDADGDALTYTWEQYNLATVADTGSLGNKPNTSGLTAVNSNTAPLFRTFQSTSGERNFPNMAYILDNANNPPDNVGEDLPAVSRTLNFRLTARDNKAGGGGVAFQEVAVTVDNTGPLAVSSFNTVATIAAGSNQNISWNVNGTNAISGNVKISLSVDGGNSFPYVLIASTPNDGSQVVNIPNNVVATINGRIKVSSLHHPTAEFFDINNVGIAITSDCSVVGSLICSPSVVNLPQGDPALNLNLSHIFNSVFSGGSKVFDNSGVSSMANFYHTSDDLVGCVARPSSSSKVIPIQVRQSGSYTFSVNSGAFVGLTVYDSGIPSCNSLIGSNRYFEDGTTWTYRTRTLSLEECKTYYIVVNRSSSFTLSINGAGDDVSEVLIPSAGINYTYAAINKSTSRISAISATANFTALGGGNYEVLGLSYPNGVNVNSFINQSISQVYGTGVCVLFSSNSKDVTVIGLPCPPSLTYTSPGGDIASGTVKQEASGTITATNKINGGNVKYDAGQSIQLNPGFVVNNGVVFSAYIDGCGGQ